VAEFLTIRQAILQGAQLLEKQAISAPRLTSEVLLAHALQKDRTYLITHADDPLTELAWIHFGRYLHQREKGVPTQYITGVQEFFGRPFTVNPSVLIPRPETELLVETALKLGVSASSKVVDIGTGSGAIAISVQLETGCRMFASDISLQAIAVAQTNAAKLAAKVRFFQGDLAAPLQSDAFDFVLSNPPYIGAGEFDGLQKEVRDHEPYVALIGGAEGTEPYRNLSQDVRRILKSDGWAVFELGFRGAADVTEIVLNEGFTDIQVFSDLAGWPRTLVCRKSP
jgi:release factor glutamine methyltransferase